MMANNVNHHSWNQINLSIKRKRLFDERNNECDYFIRGRSDLREKTGEYEYDYIIRKRSFLYAWDRVERASNGICISRVINVDFDVSLY